MFWAWKTVHTHLNSSIQFWKLKKKAVLEVYIDAKLQTSEKEVSGNIKKELPVELLYFDEKFKGPIIIFRLFKYYLRLKGF